MGKVAWRSGNGGGSRVPGANTMGIRVRIRGPVRRAGLREGGIGRRVNDLQITEITKPAACPTTVVLAAEAKAGYPATIYLLRPSHSHISIRLLFSGFCSGCWASL